MRTPLAYALLFAALVAAGPLAAQMTPRVIKVPGLRGVPPSELKIAEALPAAGCPACSNAVPA